MNCTPEEFSWKQEVNAGISNTGVTFTGGGGRARELRAGKENSSCREISHPRVSELGLNWEMKEKSSCKAWGSSGNVQSVAPKRNLPANLQGMQQWHQLSAAGRVLGGKTAKPPVG